MRILRLRFVLLVLILSGQYFSLLYAQPVSVKVFPEIPRQKITSIGGNYTQARFGPSAWDAIGQQTLKEFHPTHVRVALPMRIRQADYKTFEGAKLAEQPLIKTLLESMQKMKNEFGVKSFIVSVWDLPDELIVDASRKNQRVVKPEAYDAVIDMLLGFLLKAKNEYGVEVDYFSFNEADGGWQLIFTPQQITEFIKKAGKRFADAGLNTRFLLADTAQTLGTVEYASQIMGDSTIWKYLGPLCFHSWWSENIPDHEFERIAGLGQALNKPVWCTEMGFDAMAHTKKGMFESWDYGFRLAKIAYRMMYLAKSEVSMYWTWQNDYPIMSLDLKTMYPSYYVTLHMVRYLNEGTQILQSWSSDPGILVIGAIQQDGSKEILLINTRDTQAEVSITGFYGSSVNMISTTAQNYWEESDRAVRIRKGTCHVSLKGQSVNSILLH